MVKPKKVVLDTDPGIDDAMALLFLDAHAALDLRAITTVFGNADVATTTRNALYLRRRFGIGAPVFQGAAAPLQRSRNGSPLHIHGHDGLGDVIGTLDCTDPVEPMPAAQALVELIHANPHEITVLAIAPLTNLALALQLDPGIASLVQDVIVMGGAFGFHGRGGNVTPFAEANIHNDPEAAAIVFDAAWPITVAGLDVTSRCVLTPACAATLAASAGEQGRFIAEIAAPYAAAYRDFDGLDGCVVHDVAAIALAIDPTLFGMRRGDVTVSIEGVTIGQTTQTPPPMRLTQQICTTVDAARLLRLFTDTLIRRSSSAPSDQPATPPHVPLRPDRA